MRGIFYFIAEIIFLHRSNICVNILAGIPDLEERREGNKVFLCKWVDFNNCLVSEIFCSVGF